MDQQHIRILNLEDNPIDADLIARELKRAKLDVSISRVDTEQAFRAALETTDPDVILADYNLPGFDGIDALKIARRLAPDIPFIFASGSIGEDRAVQALREGAVDYVLKDRLSRLPSAITRALDDRRERQLRHRTQEALRLSEERFQFAVKATQEVIWDWDLATDRMSFNAALTNVWGYALPADEVDLAWWKARIHPEDRAIVLAAMDAAQESGERWLSEHRFQHADGRYGYVLDRGVVIRNGQDQPCRMIIAMLDLTEQRRADERLAQANRVSSLGRVAATIAHEFNNVLMGIAPFAEVIRRQSEDEKILKAADQITNSVARGKRVTSEILRFTQPAEPALQTVPLRDWLQNLLPELRGLAGQRVEIALQLPAEPVVVRGDPAQLQQVLTNLVLNGRDAIAGNGVVTITIGPAGDGKAMITVRDTGSGMPPEIMRNVFEPLFTTKRTGTGLGLAVAQQVITRHGGSIRVESTPGAGTTFFIELPTAALTVRAADPVKEQRKSRISRVVLVDDEPAVAAGIVLLLESDGVQVRVAERGSESLDAIEGFRPDVVILDMSLPDMRGTEVYDRIAARYPTLPVLFSSGHADEASVEHHFATGRVAFLRKPYDFNALVDALDAITPNIEDAEGVRA